MNLLPKAIVQFSSAITIFNYEDVDSISIGLSRPPDRVKLFDRLLR